MGKKLITFAVVALVLSFLISILEAFDRANHLPLTEKDLSIRVSQSYYLDASSAETLADVNNQIRSVYIGRTQYRANRIWPTKLLV